MEMSESVKALVVALIAVQAELPPITKDKFVQGDRFSYQYVSLDTVMPAALAILNKHDMALTQTVGTAEGGGSSLTTTLFHNSGEWLSDTQPLLLAKADAQGQGSAITYARRYGLMSILGIVADEDDDGAKASKKPAARRKPAAPKGTERPDPRETPDDPQAGLGRNTGQATPQQSTIIMRILNDIHSGDERAQCETVKKINPNAVNEAGTALVLKTLTQDEAGKMILGLQAAQREAEAKAKEEHTQ